MTSSTVNSVACVITMKSPGGRKTAICAIPAGRALQAAFMAAIRLWGRGAGRALSAYLTLILFAALPLTGCAARPATHAETVPDAKDLLLPVKTIQGGWLASR